jgi:hypothetical protein
MSDLFNNPNALMWQCLEATGLSFFDFQRYFKKNPKDISGFKIASCVIPCMNFKVTCDIKDFKSETRDLFTEKQLHIILHNYYSDTIQINNPLKKECTFVFDVNESINKIYISSVYYYTNNIVFTMICKYGTDVDIRSYAKKPEVINKQYEDSGSFEYSMITSYKWPKVFRFF